MKHTLSLAITMSAIWLVLSGRFEYLLLGFGVFSVLLVTYLAGRMAVTDEESHPIHLSRELLTYWPWLVWQMIRANLDLVRRILTPGTTISPTVVTVPARQQSDLGRVIHANSITLTPGTVSLDVRPGEIDVHALSREGADAVLKSGMDARVPDAGERK